MIFIRILYALVYCIGTLPFGILYFIANIVAFFLQLFGYRKKVIMQNISIVFPEKSIQEKRKLTKQFYHHLSDSLMESFKMLSVKSSIIHNKHSHLINLEILQKCYANDKEVFLLMPHIFNWEWIGFWAKTCPQKNVYAVYKPLRNKFLNAKLEQARFRVGGKGIIVREFYRFVSENQHFKDNMYVILADQSPHISKVKYSTKLFGVETAVFNGYDALLRLRNAAVVFCKPNKVKQGYYTYEFIEILPENEIFQPNEAVEKFNKLLKQSIIEHPSTWLWSHKRWKYKKDVDF